MHHDLLTLQIPENLSESLPQIISIIQKCIENSDFSLNIVLKLPEGWNIIKIYTIILQLIYSIQPTLVKHRYRTDINVFFHEFVDYDRLLTRADYRNHTTEFSFENLNNHELLGDID